MSPCPGAPTVEPDRWRWLLLAILTAVVCSPVGAQEARRPNIVLIIADDLGIGEPGCYGGELPTPNIDSLAADGVRFQAGYVTAPFCAASRAALLTGRYQTRFGFEFNPIGAANTDPAIGLPETELTIADSLRHGGYATALIGKWHLGGTARFHPQRRGFDEFFGFLHEGHYYVPPPFAGHVTWLRRRALPDGGLGRWTSPDGRTIWSTHLKNFEPDYDADNPILRSSQPVSEPANLTDALTREARQFIDRHKSQPFFVCLSYNAVHSPLQGRDDDLEKFASIEDIHRRLFAALLHRLDQGVGEVLSALRTAGVEDNTLVIFLSDNGGPTRELTSSNRPFRGEKGQLFEGGIRVPMLMKWPGRLPGGHVEQRPVISLDLFATAMRAGWMVLPTQCDGEDLLPYLTSRKEEPIHKSLFWRVGDQAAFREGDWKILCRSHDDGLPNWELYNLADDPGEKTNLAGDQAERVTEMETRWRALNYRMVPPLWSQGGEYVLTPEERKATRSLFTVPPRGVP